MESVFGYTTARIHPIEAEDTGSAVLAFRGGAQGVIQGSTACWPGDPARIELHGERGTIVLEDGRIVRWDLADARPGEKAEMLNLEGVSSGGSADATGFGHELHRRQIVDFIEAVRSDRPPVVDGAEARKALEIVLAIYGSNQSGAPVNLPLTS